LNTSVFVFLYRNTTYCYTVIVIFKWFIPVVCEKYNKEYQRYQVVRSNTTHSVVFDLTTWYLWYSLLYCDCNTL